MRFVILGAALAAMIVVAAPASAQVTIRANDDSVSIGEHHHHGWWNHRAECKVVKVRTRLPDGNVVVKTRRTCD